MIAICRKRKCSCDVLRVSSIPHTDSHFKAEMTNADNAAITGELQTNLLWRLNIMFYSYVLVVFLLSLLGNNFFHYMLFLKALLLLYSLTKH